MCVVVRAARARFESTRIYFLMAPPTRVSGVAQRRRCGRLCTRRMRLKICATPSRSLLPGFSFRTTTAGRSQQRHFALFVIKPVQNTTHQRRVTVDEKLPSTAAAATTFVRLQFGCCFTVCRQACVPTCVDPQKAYARVLSFFNLFACARLTSCCGLTHARENAFDLI
jgi:hypothetical protein